MKAAATLFLDRSTWELTLQSAGTSVPVDSGRWSYEDCNVLAERVAEALKDVGPKVRRVSLLLGASLCLTARFACESTRQSRSKEALLYRLEELIPFAAEEMLASFQREGLDVFAVATQKKPIVALASSLDKQNLVVDLVSPEACVAWVEHLKKENAHDRCAVIWQSRQGDANLVVFHGGQPIEWVYLPSTSPNLEQQLQVEQLIHAAFPPVIVYQPDECSDSDLANIDNVEVAEVRSSNGCPLRDAAITRLKDIRSGRELARFDLTPSIDPNAARKGPLRWDLVAFQLAVLVLLASLAFSNWYSLRRIEGRINEHVAAQDDVFRELFPESQLPVGVRSRLKSELGKLAGARGESEELVEPASVLPSLHRCLTAVPKEMRLRILSVKVDGERIDLSGEVRQFADADRLAAALRAAGFRVTAPKTNRLPEKGVAFRLVADRSGASQE